MILQRSILLLALSAALAAVAPAAVADEVLARVGEESITAEDLRREMLRRSDGTADQFADPAARVALLEDLVRERALVAAARAAGYAEDPQVLALLERLMVERLRADRIDPALEALEVTTEEVAAHYAEHAAAYARPARSRAAVVRLTVPHGATPEIREEVGRRAQQALAEAHELPPDVAHFGAVAVRHSDDQATRYRGGVIGWLVQHPGRTSRWDPAVVEAVLALDEAGQIGPIVETPEAFYLVRLVEREGQQERPLAVLEDGIRYSLLQERRQALRQELERDLVAEVPVRVDEGAAAAVEPPAPVPVERQEPAPPALPER